MEPTTETNDKLDDTIAQINELLDKMELEHGLPTNNKIEYPPCLLMNIEELRKKTAEDLAEYGLEINRYCLYLQRVINKKRAIGRWAKAKLDEVQAHLLPEISGSYGFNERPILARYNNEYCVKLNRVIRQMALEEDRFWDVTNNIRAMAKNLDDLKYSSIRREKDHNND